MSWMSSNCLEATEQSFPTLFEIGRATLLSHLGDCLPNLGIQQWVHQSRQLQPKRKWVLRNSNQIKDSKSIAFLNLKEILIRMPQLRQNGVEFGKILLGSHFQKERRGKDRFFVACRCMPVSWNAFLFYIQGLIDERC